MVKFTETVCRNVFFFSTFIKIKYKSSTDTHAPAVELLHHDSFLDEVLGVTVDERQSWILHGLILNRISLRRTNMAVLEIIKQSTDYTLMVPQGNIK